MEEMRFDDKGNIYPYEIIELEFKSFQDKFVISFGGSSTRQNIYKKYLVYIRFSQGNCYTLASMGKWQFYYK